MKNLHRNIARGFTLCLLGALAATTLPTSAGHTRVHHHSDHHSDHHGDRHENRNFNVNVHRSVYSHVDIDVDRHHHGGYDRGGYDHRRSSFGAGLGAGLIAGAVIGAAVAAPPRGYCTVYAGRSPYMYHSGVYYQPAGSGYVVAEPPVGVIVPTLPPGAVLNMMNGGRYYACNGLYYQPVLANGVTCYRTMRF